MTDHLIDSPETEFGHDGTAFVGNIVEEIDGMLRRTSELLAKLRVLSSDTDRASIQMAVYGQLGAAK